MGRDRFEEVPRLELPVELPLQRLERSPIELFELLNCTVSDVGIAIIACNPEEPPSTTPDQAVSGLPT
jgi:hypothetical protein